MRRWEDLPENMRTAEVRPYYDILKKKAGSRFLKRAFDIIASSVMLAVLSPVLAVLAIKIKKDSEGPVFYRQVRVTRYGRTFRIFKFRTMVVNADRIGSLVTVGGDPRITKMGAKLRGKRLDELPQLINVWRGEMSFVGTRPEVPKYVDRYTKEMLATLLMPAGVTSEASVKYKDEDKLIEEGVTQGKSADDVYIDSVLPAKMEWNLKSIREFSFGNEIKTMLGTVRAVSED